MPHPSPSLHAEQRLLEFALDRVSEACYLIDSDGCFLHVNEAACRMLGYRRDRLLTMRLFDIDPSIDAERWARGGLTDAQPQQRRHRTAQGRDIDVEWRASRLRISGRRYCIALASELGTLRETVRYENEFRALIENSQDLISRYDPSCRRIYVNAAFCRMLGHSPGALLGRKPSEQFRSPEAQAYEQAIRDVVTNGLGGEFDFVWPAPDDGRLVFCRILLTPEFSADGRVVSVLAVGRDISEIKETERRLRQAEAMARLGHWYLDLAAGKAGVSDEMRRIFGQATDWQPEPEEFLSPIVDEDRAQLLEILDSAYAHGEGEVILNHRAICGGRLLHLHSRVRIEYGTDRKPRRLLGTTQDVSELHSYESRLRDMACHDPLTGLPNRTLLNDRLSLVLEQAQRHSETIGLMILDIDRFKEINDTYGHDIGDRLLHETAHRLRLGLRADDTIARLGGDEFAVVLRNIRNAADLCRIARKILDAVARPYPLDGQEFFLSASLGIAAFPDDGRTGSQLMQYADAALHDAKARGRDGFRFYSAELTARARERASLESALRHAAQSDEFELFYQPQIDLACGRLIGGEALVRWRHPELGLIQPERFIGIAEETGLIVDIGAWVLRQACRDARHWNQQRGSRLKIAVNLSSRQFSDNDLFSRVESILAETGCAPEWLEFEITESMLVVDDESIPWTLHRFRDLGISIAIDDFGTGYSSLAYLKRFPIDVLKIDRSFINDVVRDHDSTELVKGIITLARSLRLALVAEGIESEVQERFLQTHGCQFGQGYRYGKPMPGPLFEATRLICAAPVVAPLPLHCPPGVMSTCEVPGSP